MNESIVDELRVLCLSFRIPPDARPATSAISKMVKQWIARKYTVVVVGYESGNATEEHTWDIPLPVYTIPTFHVPSFITHLHIPGLAGLFEQKYYRDRAREILPIIKKHNLNIIFSYSNPIASNIIGSILKKKTGLPFVAHMTDPWYDSPYLEAPIRTRRRILREERTFIESCDVIIFVNEQLKHLVMKKYPVEWMNKAKVIPNFYDAENFSGLQRIKSKTHDSKKFVFSHVGFFYPQRNPKKMLEIFRLMFERHPELRDKVVFQCVGSGGGYSGYKVEDLVVYATELGIFDVLNLVPPVSYAESLQYMMQADVLVAIDADMSPSPFLMSKIVDYAASGVPIIALTPEGSTTMDFLSHLGYRGFNYTQESDMAEYLAILATSSAQPHRNSEYLAQYEIKNTTTQLFEIFNAVHQKYLTKHHGATY